MTDEIIDLNEINQANLLRLYSQLKLLAENGEVMNPELLGGTSSYDKLEGVKTEELCCDDVETVKELMDRFNKDSTINFAKFADKIGQGKKELLEKVLDLVFTKQTMDVNFGRLMQEFGLTVPDVECIKDYLLTGLNVTIRKLLTQRLLLPCDLEIVLAIIFSEMDNRTLQEQYDSFANSSLVFEITSADIESFVVTEFEDARKRCEESMVSDHVVIDARINEVVEKYAKVELDLGLIDKDLHQLTSEVNDLCNNDVEVLKKMCANERCSIDDHTPGETYEVPRKIARYNESSDIADQNCASTTCGDEQQDDIHVTQIRQQVKLFSRTMPSPPPMLRQNDGCWAKRNTLQFWEEALILKMASSEISVRFYGTHEVAIVPKNCCAFLAYPTWIMEVGERVVAKYDGNGFTKEVGWLGGIIAEPPSDARNHHRYLIFFDNGEAQYLVHTNIRRVSAPSVPAYLDIPNEEVRKFIMNYMKKYPERAVVRLKVDQLVKVLRNNEFVKTKVLEVDGLMVRVKYDDNSTEWLYRGNARLEPIHAQEVNVRANIQSGRNYRRTNRLFAPVVEYVSDDDAEEENETPGVNSSTPIRASSGSMQVARKSTGTKQKSATTVSTPPCYRNNNDDDVDFIEECLPKESLLSSTYSYHKCSHLCLTHSDEPSHFKGCNPLSIPMRCGWERIVNQKFNHSSDNIRFRKKVILYATPCSRRLRSIKEVDDYLLKTESHLTVDLFCFDPSIRPFTRMVAKKTNPSMFNPDFTNGKENVKIECFNGYSAEPPMKMNYEPRRYTTDRAVNLPFAHEFLTGCDCKDNCSNKATCACHQLTLSQAVFSNNKLADINKSGYEYRRLPRTPIFTGIFECNSLCKCNVRCSNRVVQNPINAMLQLFKTKKCGWGVRTLYDIPKGSFIAIYAGNVLSDKFANDLGKIQGDEYFAELDLIQLAEDLKEGFEEEAAAMSDAGDINSDTESENGNGKSSRGKEKFNVASAEGESSNSNTADIEEDEDVVFIGMENFSDPPQSFSAQPKISRENIPSSGVVGKRWSIAQYMGEDHVYTLDAKVSGNIGRYFNHSCSPNVFVQNVYVDTHDLSLPWVAFFANQRIKAGTELCWDYSYTVGSVPGKEIRCYCGSSNCRRRLL